jgi:hypothetical protein
MPPTVRPIVRLVLPCETISHDPAAGRIVLTNPIAVASHTAPFDVPELWVYSQLTAGVGTFRLSVDLRQVYDDGTPPRVVGRSDMLHLTFPGANQLNVYDIPFRMADVPFDGPGLYEFRVLADDTDLEGHTAVVRLFDPGTTP